MREIFYFIFTLRVQGVGIEESNVMLTVIQMFGTEFQYRYERFISGIFRALATHAKILVRSDPMTRKHEVVRTTDVRDVQLLLYNEFMELMTCCEEVFCGSKTFREHPVYAPRVVGGFYDPAEPFDLTNLGCVVTNEYPNKFGVDSSKSAQYFNRGIDVSYKVSKQKKLMKDYSRGELEKGIGNDSKQMHIDVFEKRSREAAFLINKLFS